MRRDHSAADISAAPGIRDLEMTPCGMCGLRPHPEEWGTALEAIRRGPDGAGFDCFVCGGPIPVVRLKLTLSHGSDGRHSFSVLDLSFGKSTALFPAENPMKILRAHPECVRTTVPRLAEAMGV